MSAPVITRINPTSASCNSPDIMLNVTGSGFTVNSMITVARTNASGPVYKTIYNSSTSLSTLIPPSRGYPIGSVLITVKDGQFESNGLPFYCILP